MIKQKKRSKKPIPVLDFVVDRSQPTLPCDYFVLLFPINSLMTLILTLLMISAIDPEDYSIIPGLRENKYAQGGWIAGCLFAFLLFINLVTTIHVIKLCEKHRLNSTTTTKWIGQTLISGVLSWKALKDADSLTNGDKLASTMGMEECLVGPFFLTCNKFQSGNNCNLKQNEKFKRNTRSDPNVKQNKRNMKNTRSTPNVYQTNRQNNGNCRYCTPQSNRTGHKNQLLRTPLVRYSYSPLAKKHLIRALSYYETESEEDE